ncbi:HD-GYP domain-containing protein [Marinomonas balearica]|uniref:HD-GYP domain-containing protein (C-di-GMP phosphodiesterase class II) n=1 Tax=Marinomonas balearica TaxID=491947 RepID=A0A4R6M6K6_9GAMM|nr:HD domain-containing phosphohydrolase [Marinomonas balearica]TDO96220.1 HD-GYP domain-containing protein (c-di-GMP phosphodiesterase class II) [Marinomonas balearica]
MSIKDVDHCFGVDINFGYFDLSEILDAIRIKDDVLKDSRVTGLVKKHSKKHQIVNVVMRQVALDELKPLLNDSFLSYDPYFKESSIAGSQRERRYDAEERFLLLCLSIAMGKSVRSIRRLNKRYNSSYLREMYPKGVSLYRYLRRMLNDQTRDYIMDYKSGKYDELPQEDAVEGAPRTREVNSDTEEMSSDSQSATVLAKEKVIRTLPFREEVDSASDLMEEGLRLIQSLFESVRRGDVSELAQLEQLCKKIDHSYRRNPYALLVLRHIKNSDNYLAQHMMGVAVLSCHMGHELGLSSDYIQAITLGGLLMDIGRSKLPKEMMNKASKLTEMELGLFHKHIDFGQRILSRFEKLPKVAYLMLADHHEKPDSTGYPKNKEGSEISIYGKIGAIVDAYDAMTSEQTHKASMGAIKARQILLKESGVSFDKEITAVFIRSIGVIPVGSCVQLSNGRIGFVMTLNKKKEPSLVRQVYSLSSNTLMSATDMQVDVVDVEVVKEVNPSNFNIQFTRYIF